MIVNWYLIVFSMIYMFKQVEIKRTIPKGSQQANYFKTKKVFVGGIPTSVAEGMFLSPSSFS